MDKCDELPEPIKQAIREIHNNARSSGMFFGVMAMQEKLIDYYSCSVEPLNREDFMYKAGWLDCIKQMQRFVVEDFKVLDGDSVGKKKVHR